jgi:hypothetical protein
MCRLENGVNAPLIFRVSGIRGVRARELDATTREVASSENARGKINVASQWFVKGRCQGWTLQLARWRVARNARGRSTFADFQVSEDRTRKEREFSL